MSRFDLIASLCRPEAIHTFGLCRFGGSEALDGSRDLYLRAMPRHRGRRPITYANHRRLQTCHARKVSNLILDDRAASSSLSSLSHFLGAMRCGKSGRAVYQLHCLFHRMPHSHAQAQEDALKNEGRR